ncbi:hypothetical protein [Streptomyces mirabilis]|nr:hypothetical protein [Streptomyces mirabilis]MCX4612010.1 hypothetical protein [Streptomyces mirabilis]
MLLSYSLAPWPEDAAALHTAVLALAIASACCVLPIPRRRTPVPSPA